MSTSDEQRREIERLKNQLLGDVVAEPTGIGEDDETLTMQVVSRESAREAWHDMQQQLGAIPTGIFRAYDIRGLADTELTDELSRRIGQAFATVCGGRGQVVVGGDVRLSTPRIRKALAEGLRQGGCDVLDIGVVPTPVVYWAMHHLGAKAVGGIAVTGSHNPPEYNGFKLCVGTSNLHGEEIQRLLRLITDGPLTQGAGRIEENEDLAEDYMEMLLEKVELAHGLKVVVDAANGAASRFAHYVYKRMGCSVIRIHCEEDGRFPNHPADPTLPEAMVDLQRTVLEEGADLGIGFDGDADRIGIVDDRGRLLWGDQFMALFFREVLAKNPGAPAIVEVKCSQALVDDITKHGGKPFFYKTGHSLIKAKMKELNAPFTGEMSGHMFFADEFFGHDDAIYAGARLMRIIAASGRPLSELLADLPQYFATPELRVDCPDDRKFDIVARVAQSLAARYDVLDIDGARVQFSDGWGLVRCSNTSPKIIVRAEGRTSARKDEILKLLIAELAPHEGIDLAPLNRELGR